MNKLYHYFYVSEYKGGELHSNTNLTLEALAEEVEFDIEELREWFIDDERSKNISKEDWDDDLKFIKLLPDDILEEAVSHYFYPGNRYAYDSYSDYEIYETQENGELKEINPCKYPEFIQFVRKNIIYCIEMHG